MGYGVLSCLGGALVSKRTGGRSWIIAVFVYLPVQNVDKIVEVLEPRLRVTYNSSFGGTLLWGLAEGLSEACSRKRSTRLRSS